MRPGRFRCTRTPSRSRRPRPGHNAPTLASGTLIAMDTGKSQAILVVEDEASIASFVALYLKNAGYTVQTAATGGEALAQVMSKAPALIVLDLNLPDIDGIEICRRIRKTGDVP